MTWLLAILEALLRALLPVLFERSRPHAEDSRRQPELRDRLRRRVRKTWGAAVMVLLMVVLIPGCGTRTIYVPPGEPVRLRETIRNAKVWILDKDGKPVAGRMDLPEGWYCLSLEANECAEGRSAQEPSP